jgi:hypothetical protein
MADPILPAFWRYPKEGQIIGRMVAGYADLEFELSICVGTVLGDQDRAIRTIFRVRGEDQRIQTADALMRSAFEDAGLREPYCDMIADLGWCKATRNRYAHCHWYDTTEEGLCFIDLEAWAKKNVPLKFKKYRLNLPLLEQQEAYFRYVQRSMWHLVQEKERASGKKVDNVWRRPVRLPRPEPHAGEVEAPSMVGDA